MPEYTLKGRIAQKAGITIKNAVNISVEEPNIGKISARAAIVADEISITCTVPRELRGMDFAIIHLFATSAVEGVINLISIKRGWVLDVVLVEMIHPNGYHEAIIKKFPLLGAQITAFELTPDDLEFVSNIATENVMFLRLLKNMAQALANPASATVNCNIVVEGIRNLVCQNDKNKDAAWPIMREKLNLTEKYTRVVTGSSRDARHGRLENIDNKMLTEVMSRTWTIFNRYIELKKTPEAEKLDIIRFPLLD